MKRKRNVEKIEELRKKWNVLLMRNETRSPGKQGSRLEVLPKVRENDFLHTKAHVSHFKFNRAEEVSVKEELLSVSNSQIRSLEEQTTLAKLD